MPSARTSATAVVAGALALAALSLVLPWSLAFDPEAWLTWGREMTRGTFTTSGGPSWKPLPVLFTTPFALAGGAAPALWLVVARAGGLLAVLGAGRLGRDLGGWTAGTAAGLLVLLSPWWLLNTALGNSEGILAATVLWAVVAHLHGRVRGAVALGVAAALLRPEVWPFLGLYGLWAWRRVPSARRPLCAGALLVPGLWFGPDLFGAGGALGASEAARGPASAASAANADVPVLAVLGDAFTVAGLPVALAVIVSAAAAVAMRARAGAAAEPRSGAGGPDASGTPVRLAGAAFAWVLLVAAMTGVGYAGNPRYLVPAAAVMAVVAAVAAARAGAPGAADRHRPGRALVATAVIVVLTAAVDVGGLRDDIRAVGVRADSRQDLERLLGDAGGAAAVRACGPLATAEPQRTLVAWRLDLPLSEVTSRPGERGTVLQARPMVPGAGAPAQPVVGRAHRPAATVGGWTLRRTCPAR